MVVRGVGDRAARQTPDEPCRGCPTGGSGPPARHANSSSRGAVGDLSPMISSVRDQQYLIG